jgi:hypothetical protein
MSHVNCLFTRDADNPFREVRENEGVTARFFLDHVEDRTAALGADGKYPFKSVEVVQFFIAGDAKNQPVRRATEKDRLRFPSAYQAFKEGREATAVDGTPLEHWPDIDALTVARLKLAHVFTLEALAGLSDAGLSAIGIGARQLQARARAFLVESGAARQRRENEDLRAELASLRAKVEEMEFPGASAAGRVDKDPALAATVSTPNDDGAKKRTLGNRKGT